MTPDCRGGDEDQDEYVMAMRMELMTRSVGGVPSKVYSHLDVRELSIAVLHIDICDHALA
jgi:hypothetical protein